MPSALHSLPHPAWPEERVALLARLTDGLGDDGLWWLSGYAAGLAQRAATKSSQIAAVPVSEQHAAARLSIVYGSQTGNAKRIAERLAQQAEASGVAVRLLRADRYPLRELKDERYLAIVISTQGDGDPSDDARGFVEYISGKRAPRVEAPALLRCWVLATPAIRNSAQLADALTRASPNLAAPACMRGAMRTSISKPSPNHG